MLQQPFFGLLQHILGLWHHFFDVVVGHIWRSAKTSNIICEDSLGYVSYKKFITLHLKQFNTFLCIKFVIAIYRIGHIKLLLNMIVRRIIKIIQSGTIKMFRYIFYTVCFGLRSPFLSYYLNFKIFNSILQCPEQKGGTECGYFVMKYMYEIIMLSHKDPKTKWKEVYITWNKYCYRYQSNKLHILLAFHLLDAGSWKRIHKRTN